MIRLTSERETWLAERMTGIGASEAAAVLGCSPWMTPYELWMEKTGAIAPKDLSENEDIEWGVRNEAQILAAFAERTNRLVVPHAPYTVVRHQEHEWMLATPDAEQSDAARGLGLVEAKNTGAYMAKDWQDDAPLNYQVQLQHQLAVTGKPWGSIVALIGGNRLKWHDYPANPRFIATLIGHERVFWECVKNGIPPAVDFAGLNAKAIARLWPEDNGEVVTLPPEAAEWDAELVRVKEEAKALEERKDKLENLIKSHIGNATIGMFPGGSYSLKTSSVKGYTVAARTQRTLRRIKAKQ